MRVLNTQAEEFRRIVEGLQAERQTLILAHAREEQARIVLEKELTSLHESYQDLAQSIGSPARLAEAMEFLFTEPHTPAQPVFLTPEPEQAEGV